VTGSRAFRRTGMHAADDCAPLLRQSGEPVNGAVERRPPYVQVPPMLVASAGQTVVVKLPVTWPPPFPNVTSNVPA